MSDPNPSENAAPQVVVYGAGWCAATQLTCRSLDRMGIPYQYRDMDRDPDAESQVRWWTGGDAIHPTIRIGDDILIEPTSAELMSALAKHGLVQG